MLEFARWKFVVMFLVLLASALYAMPNLYPSDPAVQVTPQKGAVPDEALVAQVQGMLKAKNIPYKSVAIEDKSVIVRLGDSDHQTQAADDLNDELNKTHSVAMNLASTVPAWLRSIGAEPMSLGLDLQGGVHFLMEVDQKAAREKAENAFVDNIRGSLREKDIRYSDVSRDPQGIRVLLSNAADRNKALSLLSPQVPELSFSTVDSDPRMLRGTLSAQRVQEIATKAIEQNVIVLRNRVNNLGVAEPIIQRQGSNRIVVELPGVQDMTKARDMLGGTATLEFRAVVEGNAAEAQRDGTVPPDARVYNDSVYGSPIMLSKRLLVSGDELVDATPQRDPTTGEPSVSIKLNNAGGNRMFKHTLENVGKRMGIVYIERTSFTEEQPDGSKKRTTQITERVISASTIQGVFGKDFQTTGLSQEEATNLARQLKAGALAAPVDIVEQRVIGPTLGAENIRRGVQAVLYSFGFVMVFFVVYYKMFGIVTNIALLLNLLLVVAVMSLLGATLTLPGFAGIALTVGMSVDANVLINERIREELRSGNSPLASIAAGYDKASGTIADANVTALLGGIAMAVFGSGPIRGFGITLIIGILTSMYTAVSVSRGFATLIYGRRRKLAKISI
ncbi:protein translocase subunit SecD [Arenimonas sp.]|uniref:protein translocase subunit SecD n=1 Tax=Arenimonas sp. TaxID=1872635 RepID=UPI0039E274B6